MGTKIPKKRHLTFAELQTRWRWTENDLRSAIISEEVKPSIWLAEMVECQELEKNSNGDWIEWTSNPES